VPGKQYKVALRFADCRLFEHAPIEHSSRVLPCHQQAAPELHVRVYTRVLTMHTTPCRHYCRKCDCPASRSACQQQAAPYICTYTYIHSHVLTLWFKCACALQTIDKGYTHPVQIPYDAVWLCLDKNDEYTASDSKIQIYCGACGAKPPAVSGATKPPVATAAPTDDETEAPTAVSSNQQS
jgi:hypothetical protein